MYYLYYGEDTGKAREHAIAFLNTLRSNHTVTSVGDDTLSEAMLQDMLGAHSLFNEKEVYVLDTISRTPEAFSILSNSLREIAASQNLFVVIEEKIGVKEEKLFKAHAERAQVYARPPQKEFNVFALTDALLQRDKKTLWVLLTEAAREGKSSEEIIGTLLWQLKTMRLASLTSSAEEAGLKPFVYDKAKRGLRSFTKEELTDRAHSLTLLYHEGHTGKRAIDHALEAWVLSL
jgi:DNA polymerase III delta subunit